jgi:hypothetical protein
VLIAQLEPSEVGREFPLSAEKLSPILAFYTVANLAAGIDLCKRLLEFGGLGHTCAIHSQSEAAIREFGQAVPAFRVCVNTSAVHGSIGYSTNLFPAMTLGCGAPGGNITSDNIGPQHLMNIKRIAWESRSVEHRTVPPELRMTGSAAVAVAPPVAASRSIRDGAVKEGAVKGGAQPNLVAANVTAPTAAPENVTAANVIRAPGFQVDRPRIAKIVAQVLGERAIGRGSGMRHGDHQERGNVRASEASGAHPTTPPPVQVTGSPAIRPHEIASAIANRMFRIAKPAAAERSAAVVSSVSLEAAQAAAPHAAAVRASAAPSVPAVEVSAFVSENDVRQAMTKGKRIFVGRKTILTPSARDLGNEHEVFVETEGTEGPGS